MTNQEPSNNNMTRRDGLIAFSIFGVFSALYLFTCAPGLAAYRDSGEMVILLKTLGVAHPPGYPLFTMVGRLLQLFPWGTATYKATMFSALMGALSLVILFLILRKWVSAFSAAMAVAFLGFSNPFWDLSTVPEMYTMGIFGWALVCYGLFVAKRPLFGFFVLGLFLGVRMDMLLLVPIFFIFSSEKITFRSTVLRMVAFGLGLTVFFYLLVRSLQNPWLDWGNPDSLATLFASLSRKSYSGTLDLLSLSYHTGENFGSTCAFYFSGLARTLGYAGLLFVPLGMKWLASKDKRFFWFMMVSFVVSGPLFFFLANMPPNPHALAIIEASFVLPTTLLILFTAFGVEELGSVPFVKVLTSLFLIVPLVIGFQRSNKRENFILRDTVTNLERSAPANAVVVMHKDVQLFSFWNAQLTEGQRKDISLVSTGLSASGWYWDMKRRWPTKMSAPVDLKVSTGWRDMLDSVAPARFMIGYETDIPSNIGINLQPHGLLLEASSSTVIDGSGLSLLQNFMQNRNHVAYKETPDFFSTDLIGDMARAYQYQGHQLMVQGQYPDALWCLKKSENMDSTSPSAFSDETYIWFAQNNFQKVVEVGRRALSVHQRYLEASVAYRALPDVVEMIRTEYSNAAVMVGAAEEKVHGKAAARDYYEHALQLHENAQAHYNLAVTYWNEDWQRVVTHMQRAVQLNPQMPNVQKYLAIAQQHLLGR